MNLLEGLKKIQALLTSCGYISKRDDYGSSGGHALAVAEDGIKAFESGDQIHAAYALGYSQRACVGMGTFSPAQLRSLIQAINAK